ncbi:hypothetical protein COU01_02930 [Candidatus Falkowbacteria bacterium CG10_big_fil_rev_8_21_14_0_10_44_15]|uniref:PurE domain-containing protein n=1 Tax=Candidatus Falkowbacteria bacterium CG10_big_fil_rev_8_21_14_0_10_44_15 TaxID=1974569 RepID=A0A2H0UZH6_9BACT|nr:MAG: hypothetical protein COU01_02930 [Candidatus Falkowbacteria bacterium CG10_big_fil_rev_8_21_14_0_10_44_15]
MLMDQTLKELIEAGHGVAIIVAGSDSDKPHIEKIITALRRQYRVPYEVRILSAHKQALGDEIGDFIREYQEFAGYPLAFIAVAGGTDALSGMLAFNLPFPVISCAPDATPTAPNISCLTNPPGNSNACIIRPENAARFVAQMFAWCNHNIAERLLQEEAKKVSSLNAADRESRVGMLYLGEEEED